MPAKDVKAYVKRAHMAELGIVAALPPAESSRGTSPIQAAKSRPDRKAFGSTNGSGDGGRANNADPGNGLEPLARLVRERCCTMRSRRFYSIN